MPLWVRGEGGGDNIVHEDERNDGERRGGQLRIWRRSLFMVGGVLNIDFGRNIANCSHCSIRNCR